MPPFGFFGVGNSTRSFSTFHIPNADVFFFLRCKQRSAVGREGHALAREFLTKEFCKQTTLPSLQDHEPVARHSEYRHPILSRNGILKDCQTASIRRKNH